MTKTSLCTSFLWTAASLLSAAVLFSSCASSGGGPGALVLVNASTRQYLEVSVSPAGQSDWEPLLEGPWLPAGERGVSTLEPGSYDFKATYPGGEAEDDGVKIPAGGRVDLFRE